MEEPSDVLGECGGADRVQIDAAPHHRQDVHERIEELCEDLGDGVVGPVAELLRQ